MIKVRVQDSQCIARYLNVGVARDVQKALLTVRCGDGDVASTWRDELREGEDDIRAR